MGVFDTPTGHFMGHEVYVDHVTQQYVIEGPDKKTIRVDKHLMESDTDYMSKIVDYVNAWKTDATSATTNYVNDWKTDTTSATANAKNIRQQYYEYAQKRSQDLQDVSTRDLLNEAFRRGAIKQLEMKHAVSKHMVDEYGDDYMKHLQHKLRQDALVSRVDDLEEAGVFNVGKREGGPHSFDEVEFSVDYFICKHPLTLKKEEPYADR